MLVTSDELQAFIKIRDWDFEKLASTTRSLPTHQTTDVLAETDGEFTQGTEVKIKPQLKPRGSVAKEEDPKPSHQLYKLQVKSTRSTRQNLCLWNI